MKKILLPILATVLMAFAVMPLMAGTVFADDSVIVDEVKYDLDTEHKTAVVAGGTDNLPAEVVIPATVTNEGEDYTVTGVKDSAFSNCETLTSIQIPSEVTSIGENAFYDSSIATVRFEAGSEPMTIGENAFFKCAGLSAITLRSGLTEIGRAAFYDCASLSSITIPASVTSIGGEAFSSTGLRTVTFEAGSKLETIGESAFYQCASLSSIRIPSGVTSIEKSAFYSSGLVTVTFEPGSKLKKIGESVFGNCTSFSSVQIPKSVTGIGRNAFYGSGIETLTFEPESRLRTIEQSAFSNCGHLTAITIPRRAETIEDDAFFKAGLQTITFESGSRLGTIGEDAFYDCTGLSAITFPSRVASIGSGAFLNTGLKTVTFESGSRLQVIGKGVFAVCGNLTSITLPSEIKTIEEDAFEGSGLETVSFESGSWLRTIQKGAFKSCGNLTSITIPPEATYVGESAFRNSGLKTIHFIGDEAAWDDVEKGFEWAPADPPAIHYVTEKATRRATLSADGYSGYVCNEADCSNWEYGGEVIARPAQFTLSATSYTYNGTVRKPAVTVKDAAGRTITADNYTVTITNSKGKAAASPKAAGKYTVAVKMKGDYAGTKKLTYTINKAANTLKIKAKTATIKYSKVRKAAQKLDVAKVITFTSKGQGAKTHIKKSGNRKITIAKKTGKATVGKGLKKGTYKVKVKVKAAGNANYKASAWKTVTFKVKVN